MAAPPVFSGDPEAEVHLEAPLAAAMEATDDYGPWPKGLWTVRLHVDAVSFERETRSTPSRCAQWVGAILHLRPWEQLKRRDLGSVLRHELVHRRLSPKLLRRWEEEARCLYAETHVHPPSRWPASPAHGLQDRWDRALESGTTVEQAWVYGALRAWLKGQPLPEPPSRVRPRSLEPVWKKESLSTLEAVTVRWPEERLPKDMEVNGHPLSRTPGRVYRFDGRVRFGPEMPVKALEGRIELEWHPRAKGGGWSLSWSTAPDLWVASAVAGEIGEDAPFEARRALAAVLKVWLAGHPKGHHADGTLCPLTHCAVVRGLSAKSTQRAVLTAPPLKLDPGWALFTSSKGGVSWSIREIWGEGPGEAPPVPRVEGDRWLDWERSLDKSQVQSLKRMVKPGLKPGQRGLMLGASGPYAVEDLRLASGRAFGWPSWPSNACEIISESEEGGIRLKGHGWGHNAGLCLATASQRAREGWKAEAILQEAFGIGVLK